MSVNDQPFDLSEHLREVASILPSAGCLAFEGIWWSWADEAKIGSGIAQIYKDHSLDAEGQIGLLLRNRPGLFLASRQVLTLRGTIVTLNAAQGEALLADEIRNMRLPAIAATEQDWRRSGLLGAAQDAGSLAIVVPDEPGQDVRVLPEGGDGLGDAAPRADVAVVMLTSGTTGPPKRVPLDRQRLENSLSGVRHYHKDEDSEVRLQTSPAILWASLAHIGGLYFAFLNAVNGRPVVLLERFDPHEWADAIQTYQIKSGSLAPTAMRMVLDADIPIDKIASLKAVLSGTAHLPKETWAEFESKYGIPVLPTYGSTEMAGAVAGWTIKDHHKFIDSKRGSAGRAFPGVEFRTLDRETFEPILQGRTGVLEIRGPQVPANQADGWMRTTDLAHVDDDGFLFIHGRTDDVINRGGFKVSTGIVAGIIEQHPAVKAASVIGLPDERLGMVPVAAVELAPGYDATPSELMEFVKQRTTGYQRPTTIRIVDQLPRTQSLKVSAQEVRRLFA